MIADQIKIMYISVMIVKSHANGADILSQIKARHCEELAADNNAVISFSIIELTASY